MTRSRWIAASLLLALFGLALFRSEGTVGRNAFAGTIPGVDAPKTLTWTTTYYSRVTSADGKRTWLQPERRLHAYRHPGQYRETLLDEANQPRIVEISDARVGRMLVLDLKDKKAVLKAPVGRLDLRGPFAWVGEALRDRLVAKALRVKSISLQGRKEIDKTETNVVRAMIDRGDDQGYALHDFFFDLNSKRLVAIWIPNENRFDLETAPERNQAAEKLFSSSFPVAYREHEMVLDPKLDAADFSLDPPAGYAYQALAKPTITEEEMIAYLGAAARFNDGLFPDSPYAAFDQAKFNAASLKTPADQTLVEQELIRLHDKYLTREIHRSPVLQFVEDHAEPESFHYVGAGAKLGQADRILGWYIAKGTEKQRAVFGDLSVKDVTASELPIDLSK
ncbi:hypothetical protein [Singulisphaera sp. GP187]|uniref:hypothetical protein n=1 Tax=Singulisphaera sp. GP187 TaxID=1882752 RepID=UPI001160E54B|nr:hypothetical protein [Singulisphaera sp. GP187]